MRIQVDLPDELAKLLDPNPSRAVCEAVLLQLAHDGRISVGRAGPLLGLDVGDSIRWYTSHGYPYPSMTPAELQRDLDNLNKALGG
ncbi:MAG: hypothetical protein JOZ41_09685 [Chloroflexi bacterium]|nr:hypothetical protein [Chloroflexota bacterium]